ncbi:FCD domain-containing protein [Streptomyces sp. NBC_00076]|uniref:FCD domain-containing protein n=1 Tax=Streptomyces sp. NBC_00076 TaxID=2975642 RepID=UPI00386F4FB0
MSMARHVRGNREHASPSSFPDLIELNRLGDRTEREAAEGAGLAETDRAFHATLHRALDIVLLGEVLEAFRDPLHHVGMVLVDVRQDPQVTCRPTGTILEAARSGDAIRAEGVTGKRFGGIRTCLSTTAPQGPHTDHNERV